MMGMFPAWLVYPTRGGGGDGTNIVYVQAAGGGGPGWDVKHKTRVQLLSFKQDSSINKVKVKSTKVVQDEAEPNKKTSMRCEIAMSGAKESPTARVIQPDGANYFIGIPATVHGGIVEAKISKDMIEGFEFTDAKAKLEVIIGQEIFVPWTEDVVIEEKFSLSVKPLVEVAEEPKKGVSVCVISEADDDDDKGDKGKKKCEEDMTGTGDAAPADKKVEEDCDKDKKVDEDCDKAKDAKGKKVDEDCDDDKKVDEVKKPASPAPPAPPKKVDESVPKKTRLKNMLGD